MYIFRPERYFEVRDRGVQIIAHKVGISRGYLSYILNGKRTPSKETAYCITKAVNKDKEIDYFFKRAK